MKKSRKQNNRNDYQTLEPRKMLAGNVTATVSDGLLQIIGDTEGNEIIVAGRPDGTATVFGLNDTTINGGTDPFVVSTTLDDVDVKLNAGDDNATIQGLVLSQSLRVRTHAGDDTTNVHHIEVQRFEQYAGDGDDKMEFNNVYSRGSILISGENNDDIVSITNMASGTDANLLTGNGDDTVAIDNMGVKENFNLNTGSGNDQVVMTGLVYGYRANLLLEQGNDSLSVLPTTSNETALFFRGLNIQGGDGNDSVSMDASVTSPKKSTIGGGAGTDSIQQGNASLRGGSITNFENLQVDNLNALLDSVYTALSDADIDTTPFGRAVVIDPVAPAITATTAALIQNENGGPQAVDDGLTLVGDNTTYTGATVSLGDTFVSDQDVLAFPDNSTTDSIEGTFDDTTGTLTLTGAGTPAEYQAALRAITFNNTSADPDVTTRTVTTTVTQDDASDLTATRDITVIAIDPVEPAITATAAALTQNENDGAQALDDGLTLVGDDTTFTRATVSLSTTFVAGQDVLAFTDNSSTDAITGTFDDSTGTLTLNGDGTAAEYQAALQTITFNNTSEDPDVTARTATITVSRDGGDDLTATRGITVVALDDAPVIARTSSTVDVNLDDNPTRPVPIGTDALTITDADSTQLTGAEITIDDNRVDGDVLDFTEANGITGVFEAATGILTLTGTADVADYQIALRSVTLDFAATATAGQRRVTFVATDTEGTVSAANEVLVNVFSNASVRLQTSANAEPFFREAGAPVNVDSGLSVTAEDGAMVSGATVSITSGLEAANDVLTYDRRFAKSPSDNRPEVPITLVSQSSGLMTFEGDATAAQYQSLLRSITFHSNDQTFAASTNRVIQFSVASDANFSVSRTATLEPRTEADRNEDINDRDDQLIQDYIDDKQLTNVFTTDSGLRYIVESEGSGQSPVVGDEIRVNYTGTYLNGVRFDGGDNSVFDLRLPSVGQGGLIAGWVEGFQLFSPPTGKGTLLVPSRLAYGSIVNGNIPPNSVLIFDIDLLEVNPTT